MTRIKGFIGGAYTLQSVAVDCQRCVNLFPQITESQNQADGEIGALISTEAIWIRAGRGALNVPPTPRV